MALLKIKYAYRQHIIDLGTSDLRELLLDASLHDLLGIPINGYGYGVIHLACSAALPRCAPITVLKILEILENCFVN